jgi:AbrB family looped-hinge helix DNA binding protein
MEHTESPISALVKIRRAAQITLPRDIYNAAHLQEGEYLEVQLTKDGILLCPVSVTRREPTAEQEAEILAIVDEERQRYAEESRY